MVLYADKGVPLVFMMLTSLNEKIFVNQAFVLVESAAIKARLVNHVIQFFEVEVETTMTARMENVVEYHTQTVIILVAHRGGDKMHRFITRMVIVLEKQGIAFLPTTISWRRERNAHLDSIVANQG